MAMKTLNQLILEFGKEQYSLGWIEHRLENVQNEGDQTAEGEVKKDVRAQKRNVEAAYKKIQAIIGLSGS